MRLIAAIAKKDEFRRSDFILCGILSGVAFGVTVGWAWLAAAVFVTFLVNLTGDLCRTTSKN